MQACSVSFLYFFFPYCIVNVDCCLCPLLCRFKSTFVLKEKVGRGIVATSRGGESNEGKRQSPYAIALSHQSQTTLLEAVDSKMMKIAIESCVTKEMCSTTCVGVNSFAT